LELQQYQRFSHDKAAKADALANKLADTSAIELPSWLQAERMLDTGLEVQIC
jgi:hypothetical protein